MPGATIVSWRETSTVGPLSVTRTVTPPAPAAVTSCVSSHTTGQRKPSRPRYVQRAPTAGVGARGHGAARVAALVGRRARRQRRRQRQPTLRERSANRHGELPEAGASDVSRTASPRNVPERARAESGARHADLAEACLSSAAATGGRGHVGDRAAARGRHEAHVLAEQAARVARRRRRPARAARARARRRRR